MVKERNFTLWVYPPASLSDRVCSFGCDSEYDDDDDNAPPETGHFTRKLSVGPTTHTPGINNEKNRNESVKISRLYPPTYLPNHPSADDERG